MFPTSFRSIHRLRHTMTQQKTRAAAPWQWLISLTQTQWVARTSATSWGLLFAESYLQTTWWFVKSLQQQPSTSLHSAQNPKPASASATLTGNKKIAFVQLCASVTQRYLVQHSFTSWTHARAQWLRTWHTQDAPSPPNADLTKTFCIIHCHLKR